MELSHIGMFVKNLEAQRAFYEKHFGAVSNTKYRNPKSGLETYFLEFPSGARLEIMSRPDVSAAPENRSCTGYSHIAFKVGSRDAVDAQVEKLLSDGVKIVGRPRVTGDGYYEAVAEDPEGNLIEFVA